MGRNKGDNKESVIYKRITSNIFYLRKYGGLSREELAKRSEITGSYLAAIETAKKTASFSVLEKIAEGLGINPLGLVELDLSEDIKTALEEHKRKIGKYKTDSQEETQPETQT